MHVALRLDNGHGAGIGSIKADNAAIELSGDAGDFATGESPARGRHFIA
jgi:hypothetical protein